MTKTALQIIAETLNAMTELTEAQVAARDAVNAELAKNEEKAQANRELYAQAHDVIMSVIDDTPRTVAEIYDACKDSLPKDFSKSKVQYGLRTPWADEVNKIENAKGPNQYTKA